MVHFVFAEAPGNDQKTKKDIFMPTNVPITSNKKVNLKTEKY
jgi:hypothetical protein